jgi:pantetheine-phosphate adenylyltransferase
MGEINRRLSGLETVLLLARPELAYISSGMVRELQAFGKDISIYLP